MEQISLSPARARHAATGTIAGNTLADRFSRRHWYLDSYQLCEQARRHTGLGDFGEPSVEQPLSIFANSLENEADLHPLGRFLMRSHLLGILETRLRLADAWRGQMDALPDPPITRPVFITGMPRSGSTFLHELMAQDPDNRSPKVWEVMFPVPAPTAEMNDDDPRVRKAAACLWCFRRLAPQADAVYPLRACMPHECVAIHSYSLISEEFVSTCHIPSYEHFLRTVGYMSAYAWEKRFLQHLQSRKPAKQWVLKSPDHLCSLEELFAVFPDAIIIHTHRNPLEVLKSSIELTKVLHGLFSRPDDPVELHDQQTKYLVERIERSIRFRDTHPELACRFLDVNYTELVSEPIATMERIYRHMDRPLDPAVIQRMRELVTMRSRYRRRPKLEQDVPTLDKPEEIGWFQDYCHRFGMPFQQPSHG
jgi:LPS sulfotransferase NodH